MASLSETLDLLVRRERSRLIGALLRLCGSLDAAEEALHEALVAALATWPADGLPDNPVAWLTTAARNRARDARRRRGVAAAKAPLLVESPMTTDTVQTISDDQLRLVFTCCHPALGREHQVALTLKTIAGFTTDELARAFLVPEATMAQRIVRAKRTIEDQALAYAEPGWSELPARVAAVLEVVYLVFNEGHTSRRGPLVRLDLQAEALRLGRLVAELVPRDPEVCGLVAIMAFAAARAGTRVDDAGVPVMLDEQDRSRWHLGLIHEGLLALARARTLGGRGSYVLQAEIAACHVTAPTWQATDWPRILACYDDLLERVPSPVVALNRAVAICMVDGPEPALAELDDLAGPLADYHLYHATRADFLRRLGRDARADYRRALELATNDAERRFLARRLATLDPPRS